MWADPSAVEEAKQYLADAPNVTVQASMAVGTWLPKQRCWRHCRNYLCKLHWGALKGCPMKHSLASTGGHCILTLKGFPIYNQCLVLTWILPAAVPLQAMPINDGWLRDWGPTCIARPDPVTGKRQVAGVHWDYDCCEYAAQPADLYMCACTNWAGLCAA